MKIPYLEAWKKISGVLLLFLLSFAAGHAGAAIVHGREAVPVSAEGNWGLSFQQEGKPPVANATADELLQYNAYYSESFT